MYKQQVFINEMIDSKDSGIKHLKFNFVVIPINISPTYFKFDDKNCVKYIKNLYNEVKYKSPYYTMRILIIF